ncbi:MAG: hypothetical protein NTU59_01655, partial [Coprothermobacterota bacterium]|nr:hypothetical protein [Coprothermobacterota bacterium]
FCNTNAFFALQPNLSFNRAQPALAALILPIRALLVFTRLPVAGWAGQLPPLGGNQTKRND